MIDPAGDAIPRRIAMKHDNLPRLGEQTLT